MNSIKTTAQLLNEVSDFISSMNKDNSTTFKTDIFRKWSMKYNDTNGPFLRLIVLVNDKLVKFNVTAKSVLKYKDKKTKKKRVRVVKYKDDNENLALFKLLGDLSDGVVTGHSALESIINFCTEHQKHESLILNIIDKDLKTRFTAKNINKVVKNLVPVFDVSLGESYKDCITYFKKPYKNGWYISRKLDGVRCICMIKFVNKQYEQGSEDTKKTKRSKKGSSTIDSFFTKKSSGETKSELASKIKVEFYSRQGKRFWTLKKLETDIVNNLSKLLRDLKTDECKGFVLDGEVCKIDFNGLEDFQGIMKEINKKNHTMENPKYLLFDILTLEEFNEKTSDRVLSSRLSELSSVIGPSKCKRISVIQQVPFTEKGFSAMEEQVKENGWEGLILRKNDVYKGKRSKDILKVKQFFREEYKVEDVEFDTFRAINTDTGLEEEIEVLKAVTIFHKGYPVSVGSGFKLDERKKFKDNPGLIKGKIISVQFFEETKDKNGHLSLRFPTYQGLYGKKRTF
jgi:DNA ligase-1